MLQVPDCGEKPSSFAVVVGSVSSMLSSVQHGPCSACYVVPLHVGALSLSIWMPLSKGSLLQRELGFAPGDNLAKATMGQPCPLQAWEPLLVEEPLACCIALDEPACQGLWLVGKLAAPVHHGAPPCLSAAFAPVSSLPSGPATPLCPAGLSPPASSAALSKGDDHKMNLWGESSFSSSEGEAKRWYHRIPMPTVELVDKDLLYDVESDHNGMGLDGLRLAAMSAVRDQETALARELQSGDEELAKLTATNLAEMNRTIDGLEDVLFQVSENFAALYEDEGPQNRDISLRSIGLEEGAELLQAKIIPINEVCDQIETWREAIGEEVASVINKHKAGTFRTESEVKALEAEGKFQIVRVPGKLVAAIKPPRKYKARLVACGNFLHREKTRKSATLDRTDLYCSNLDIFSLRIQLAIGVQKGWRAASKDVKTAFLTAPFQAGRTPGPEGKNKVIMVKVPRAVVLAGFAPAGS